MDRAKRRFADDEDERSELGTPFISDDEGGIAQWVDDDLEPLQSDDDESSDEHHKSGSENEGMFEKELASISFGALAKANRDLGDDETSEEDESESVYQDQDQDFDQSGPSTRKEQKTREEMKRQNKHAPMEMSSKRPVPMRRQVVQPTKIERRDPRFSSLSGSFSSDNFQAGYSFLNSLQESEFSQLKTELSNARKLLAQSPEDQRSEREEDVERLQRALKRVETTVERTKREKRDRDALRKAKKEEREKQQNGKKAWFMKNTEKRELLTKARFEELESLGGKQAVNKVIEKRRIKISQKDKRNRPDGGPMNRSFGGGKAISQAGGSSSGTTGATRSAKRRRET